MLFQNNIKFLLIALYLICNCASDCQKDYLKGGGNKKSITRDTLYFNSQNCIIELRDTNISPKSPTVYYVYSTGNYRILLGLDWKNKTYNIINIDSLAGLCPSLSDSTFSELYMRILWSQEKNNGIELQMVKNGNHYLITNTAMDTIELFKMQNLWRTKTIRINKKMFD